MSHFLFLACDSRYKLSRDDVLAFEEAKAKVGACAHLDICINPIELAFVLAAADFK
jgi:hypothetical protein